MSAIDIHEAKATGATVDQKTGAVLVLGGGIAGMQSSIDLANAGYLVHLVTSDPSIGGKMVQLDKTFPTNDCAMCLLGPKMTDCQSHPNIHIHTVSDLVGLEGEPGHFTAKVLEKARYVDVDECTACGECEAVCPVELPNPFNIQMDRQKAIHKMFPQAVPNKYLIEKAGTPPCRNTCPADTNAQGYAQMVAKGKFAEAVEVVMRAMPFPGVCGRICHHPCETECNRADHDDPIAIATLKRAASDFGWDDFVKAQPELPPVTRAEKIAVIGAGPAGLTAARDLRAMGYAATVFDALDRPGGLLRAGIPRYRLGLDTVDRETEFILRGVEFRGGVRVGRDITIKQLQEQGYRAVLVAVGTQLSRRIPLEGSDAKGVLWGLDFLRDAALAGTVDASGQARPAPEVRGKVLIIGGGNVAIDAARTALRLGAAEVHCASLEARHEMPAHQWEILEAVDEGVVLHPSRGPRRVLTRDGRIVGMELIKVKSVFDENRRFNPTFHEGTEEPFACDTIILAIGQATDLSLITTDLGVKVERGLIVADKLTKATGAPGLFAAGDAVRGPASVVEAVASGHEAAISIDRYLNGADLAEGRTLERGPNIDPPKHGPVLVDRRRVQGQTPAAERVRDFREVLLGFTREEAMAEAARCLNCGLCSECLQCVKACQKKAIHHEDVARTVDLPVGAVVLTPGYRLFDARLKGEYGYGYYPNVMTSIEFERLLSASGPTKGAVLRRSDGHHPKRIAFIQCVGSRDASEGAEYCSSICCMYSTKEAIIAREHDKSIEATIFFIDMRAFGKNFDRYVDSAKNDYGVRYIRSMISSVKEDPLSGNLRLRYTAEGKQVEEEFDLVVLAVGVRPPDARGLADVVGIELNEYGYARIGDYDPTQTTREGVFVAGCFQGPRDIPETVMNASAAAAKAAGFLAEARGTMVVPKVYPKERDVSGEPPRVGVFICRCGINIASIVDVPRVVEFAKGLKDVAYVQETIYTCSQDSLKNIREKIDELKLNRVLVASCTIRTHQPLFREALREAGLNQFLFEMANIRDQASWVHRDVPEMATEKALDLVRMGVGKARKLEPLHLSMVPVTQKALVIGGGPAGLTAALSLAEQGFESFLVEREDVLGGHLREIRYTMNRGEMSRVLDDLLRRVDSEPKIHVFKNAEVTDFGGHAGHFTTTIRQRTGPGSELARNHVVEHGVAIVAVGAREYQPTEYLYGRDPRVVTRAEFEQALAAGERVVTAARRVVFLQCVGSRDETHKYCSRTCCGQSVRNAIIVKEKNPEAEVYILYRDVRTYGFLEQYYREAREKGVTFVQWDEEAKPEAVVRGGEGQGGQGGPGGRLVVRVRDGATGRPIEIDTDLLVLATGTAPAEGVRELGTMLKVPVNEDGFFLETHIKLMPMDFPSQGIFLCGAAHSPKFVDEAIYQAQGAVARALAFLSKTELSVGGVVAKVEEEKCAACLTCVRVCPFSVPLINERGKAEINSVQCQGCGTCAGECPAKAIQLQHYKDEQILAKIGGLAEVSD
ncbi:MAG TPA: FAD-dependent oxidoreductase [Bacillota bacterium]|jgi:heterodisulfide reductase subunit A-like polyferredoxin